MTPEDIAKSLYYDGDMWADFVPGEYILSGTPDEVEVVFGYGERDGTPLTEDEIKFIRSAVELVPELQSKLREWIVDYYRTFHRKYATELAKHGEALPDPSEMDPESIDHCTCLTGLFIYQLADMPKPYLGFGFSCNWDREHGVGFMTYDKSLVEIGGADTPLLRWIAERHARDLPR